MGKDAWVQAELVRMVRGQDARLKLIVALARHVGPEATSCGRSIGLQSARLMLQYSAGEWHGACGGGGEEQSDGLQASDEAEPGGGGAGAATGG